MNQKIIEFGLKMKIPIIESSEESYLIGRDEIYDSPQSITIEEEDVLATSVCAEGDKSITLVQSPDGKRDYWIQVNDNESVTHYNTNNYEKIN